MKKIILLCASLLCVSLQAQTLKFENISEGDFEKIIKELSAGFSYTTVSSASSLGKEFGVEVGLLVGLTKTPDLNNLVKSADPTTDASQVPTAALIAQLSLPNGVTFEAAAVPKLGGSNFKYSNWGVGIKWTLTESVISELPLSLALKANYSVSKVDANTTAKVGSTPVESSLRFEDKMTGFMLMASKDLILFEPYIGIGTISADGELAVTGAGNIFSSAYTSSSSARKKVSGNQLLIGTEIKLAILKFGLEYEKVLGKDRYSAKVAVSF